MNHHQSLRYLLACILFILYSCESDEILPTDLISKLIPDKTMIVADGTEAIKVTALLNEKADKSFWKVDMKTSSGVFKSNGKSEIEVMAEKFPDGKIMAESTIATTNKAGQITITAEIENYPISTSVEAVRSEPTKIELAASTFNVQVDFGSEIIITGTLKNASDKNASKDYQVSFMDFYAGTTDKVGGHFRMIQNKSNSMAQVSAIYSPGYIVPDTTISIQVSLDDNSDVKNTINIFVTPKQM